MTDRDEVALTVLRELICCYHNTNLEPIEYAEIAYKYADAMARAEKENLPDKSDWSLSDSKALLAVLSLTPVAILTLAHCFGIHLVRS